MKLYSVPTGLEGTIILFPSYFDEEPEDVDEDVATEKCFGLDWYRP